MKWRACALVAKGPQSRSRAHSRKRASGSRRKRLTDISGLSHGVGWCAPQQGACKLTLNVKNGVIEEALVETLGCSGMTHSAAMAAEILPGKTILEALNTDLVCDAINVAMREIFLQLVYGRTQTAFSEDGLPDRRGAGGSRQGPALPGRHHVLAPRPRACATWRWRRAMCSAIGTRRERRGHRLQVRPPRQDDGGHPQGRATRRKRMRRISAPTAAMTTRPKYIDPREE